MLERAAPIDLPARAKPVVVATQMEPLGAVELRRPRTGTGAGHHVLLDHLDHLERRLDRLDAFADRVDQRFNGLERQVTIVFAERRAWSRVG